MKNYSTIKCPKCNWEYLPEEIFIAKNFLGHHKNVVKDERGQILSFEGVDQDLTESFVCEHCGKTFNVKASVSFEASVDLTRDFDEEYSTPLYSTDRHTLGEE